MEFAFKVPVIWYLKDHDQSLPIARLELAKATLDVAGATNLEHTGWVRPDDVHAVGWSLKLGWEIGVVMVWSHLPNLEIGSD